jgi:hypothetical protein
MLSKVDAQDILQQFQRNIPVSQIVREFVIANPPMLEQCCSLLPEQEQIPILKKLVRIEAGRIACVGIETFDELNRFMGIVECCRKHNWIDGEELGTVLFEVRRWIDSNREGEYWKVDEAEAAIMRIAFGLSHRMF